MSHTYVIIFLFLRFRLILNMQNFKTEPPKRNNYLCNIITPCLYLTCFSVGGEGLSWDHGQVLIFQSICVLAGRSEIHSWSASTKTELENWWLEKGFKRCMSFFNDKGCSCLTLKGWLATVFQCLFNWHIFHLFCFVPLFVRKLTENCQDLDRSCNMISMSRYYVDIGFQSLFVEHE